MTTPTPSQAFFPDEITLQERTGRRALADVLGPRIVPHMTPEASTLFASLPFVFAGSIDARGRPWASILTGPVGFMEAEGSVLQIDTTPCPRDPLDSNLVPVGDMALIGIDLVARLRYRVNGVGRKTAEGIAFTITQCYRNCPQYINGRAAEFKPERVVSDPAMPQRATELDARMLDLVRRADTFFIATHATGQQGNEDYRLGADISHRGGNPGFVVAAPSHLSWPDYTGNFMFNTLGNLSRHPFAGLIFVDFTTGSTLQITGKASADWSPDRANAVPGAQRMLDFDVEEAVWTDNAVPIAWGPLTMSRDLRRYKPADTLETHEGFDVPTDTVRGFRPLVVSRAVEESEVIRSLYLRDPSGGELEPFLPGQHLQFHLDIPGQSEPVIRHYSLSHHDPERKEYRIGVRRVTGDTPGVASNFIHDEVKVGSVLQVSQPRGKFVLDTEGSHPLALISAGIGITPMLSMLLALVAAESTRPIVFLHGNRNSGFQAFAAEIRRISDRLPNVTAHFCFSEPRQGLDILGRDYETAGIVDGELLERLVPSDAEAFICGPESFMHGVRDLLIEGGLAPQRVHFESFGSGPSGAVLALGQVGAHVTFADQGIEAQWSDSFPSLLDLGEAVGAPMMYACRAGNCGTCEHRLLKGEVVYAITPSYDTQPGHVLVCCAQPTCDVVIAPPDGT